MARIDYSDPAKASERTREILGKNRNANIFRMMAHSPSYFEQYCRLGGAIRHKGELDPVVRELAITRTGILCEALIELQLSVGFYIMTSKFLETFAIDMQPVTEVV
jgi:alkylhydroperoxidase family enzyme